MTEQTNQDQETNDAVTLDELAMLKQRADLMGIAYSNNIKVETLRARIEAKMSEDDAEGDEDEEVPAPTNFRQQLMDDAHKLVRVRVANLDPKKKDLHGEIFTVANEFIGTVRKFVPYGEATDDGYHIPFCIYQMLEEKRFLHIKTRRNNQTGQISTEQSWQKEFAIEVLPQLTEKELSDLARAQIAAGSVTGTADEYLS